MQPEYDLLDQAEEIFLTEDQISQWLTTDAPSADKFMVEGEQLALKNMDPNCEPPPVPQFDLQQLVDRAFSKPLAYWQRNWDSIHTPVPEVRKLERPHDAEWTLFRHSDMVIGVHDGGTVVARDLTVVRAHEYRVTNDGNFHCDGREQDGPELGNPATAARVAAIRDAVRLWVMRAKNRKTPPGFRRLWGRVTKAAEVGLLNSPPLMSHEIHQQPLMIPLLRIHDAPEVHRSYIVM